MHRHDGAFEPLCADCYAEREKQQWFDRAFQIRYRLAPVTAAQLWPSALYGVAGAAQVQTTDRGVPYKAISIDPQSDIHDALLFFDDSTIGVPLVIGQVLHARYEEVRVSTVFPSPQLNGLVASGAGNWSQTNVLMCPQVLRLRLWTVDPPFELFDPPSELVLRQTPLSSAAQAMNATWVLAAYAPGAKTVQVGGSNANVTGAGTVVLSLYGMRPSPPGANRDATPAGATPAGLELPAIGTDTIPVTADNNQPIVAKFVDPGTDVFVVGTGANAVVGTYNASVYLRIVFNAVGR